MSAFVSKQIRKTAIAAPPIGSWVFMLMLTGCIVVAGLMAPGLAGAIEDKGIGKVLILLSVSALVALGGLVTVTRKEPIRFAFLGLFALLPFAATPVPPSRFQLTVFDLGMFLITAALVWTQAFAPRSERMSWFPVQSLRIAMLLLLACVAFSRYPLLSVWTYVEIFVAYVFFLLVFMEAATTDRFQNIVCMFAIAVCIVALGVFLERLLKVNLSLRVANSNLVSQVAGLEIRRGAGFFQDPQKAAQFLGCGLTFLLLLAVRRRFEQVKVRWLLWTSIALAVGGLVATISRSALLASVLVSAIFVLVFGRWSGLTKMAAFMGGLVLLAAAYLLVPGDVWLRIGPSGLAERFSSFQTSIDDRMYLWFLAKDAFTNQPLTGVGLGGFGPYVFETRMTSFLFTGGQRSPLQYILGQPESGYFKIVYEGGLVGVLAVLVVVVDVIRRAVGCLKVKLSTYDLRTDVIAAFAGLVVFGISFTTLFTVSDERNLAILVLFLAVIFCRTRLSNVSSNQGESSGVGRSATR